jgi:hypothetical protein
MIFMMLLDIDAHFGKIWVHNRLLYILTPQEQEKQTMAAFAASNVKEVDFEVAI